MSDKLYNSFCNLDTKLMQILPSCPTLILSISQMGQPGLSLRRYAENILSSGTPLQMAHVDAEPFWDNYWRWECQAATDSTIEWLKEIMSRMGS